MSINYINRSGLIQITLDRFPAEYVGLGKYWRGDLSPGAADALTKLHECQWLCGAMTTCACGRRFHTWSGIRCEKCRRDCKHKPIHGYIIQGDGRYAPKAYCGQCGETQPGPFGYVGRSGQRWLYDYCFKDNRHDEPPQPCERCGSPDGSQLHHWAPQAIFADADDWPTGWLCPRCHSTWHEAMRAARGNRLPWEGRHAITQPELFRNGGGR